MTKSFEIDLPKEIMDVFIQFALVGLCFFSSVKIIKHYGSLDKISVLTVVAYGVAVCLLAGIYFFVNAAIKSIKRYYSELPLELVIYDDRMEVFCNIKKFSLYSELQHKVIILETIKKISLKGSPDANVCWVKILYVDKGKLKKVSINKTVFKSSKSFKEFLEELKERHLLKS
ncbi:hypothetical protein SHI21_13785 [Bacteriovorax sp. PP10]|uniref:YcxB-like protein domain-containing protein n=1 Tax=Bacteriovorax antarcticus TaxID=3088717 RepID=A0ABU5VW69_9BACT|nr:hypothetical protein [Bacteriovorax sp. PP10]MEA9357291.1 hypothetical protein [Bacteriovorax sp. PP10]